MAIASWMIRGRSLRSGRFNRNRLGSEDENVQLDLSKDPKENIQEIFSHVCQRHGVVEGKRLGYLNAFVKLVSQPDVDHTQLGYTKDELFCCLRTALVHETTQVRAAGLRAIRYLIQDTSDASSLIKLQIPSLIARSLDLALRNDMERIQAVRIMRRLLFVNPAEFPVSLARCLVSLANGAAEANDRMLRASLAVLAEICVLNPLLLLRCGGISSIVRNVLDCRLPKVAESLVGCLLFLLDKPDTRNQAQLDLQCLAEPYCDFYFRKASATTGDRARDEKEIRDREMRLRASHRALLSVLRSWPGLLHFCSPRGNSGLRALVDILYLKQLDIRKAILDLLYDLLGIPLPEWTDELSVALDAVDPSHPQDSWRLHEGFVAAEGRAVLPHLSKFRPNIVVNHLSVLLQAFLEAGLLAAVVEVIVAEDTFLSVRATILLGQLLHMMHLLLPAECCNTTPPLPSLMWYAVGASWSESQSSPSSCFQRYDGCLASTQPSSNVTKGNQQQALASVAAMNQLHRLLKRRPAPASLFLAQLLNSASRFHSETRRAAREDVQAAHAAGTTQTSPSDNNRGSSSRRRRFSESVMSMTGRSRHSKSKLQQMVTKESEEALKESGVLTNKDGFSWNWEVVRSILKSGSESLLKLEDSNHRTFIKRLVHHYKPSSNRFSRVELGSNRKQTNMYSLAGIELIDVLLLSDEEGFKMLLELLSDISSKIEEITTAKSAHDCLFSPQHTSNSLCQDYFLFIGHMCQISKGLSALESTGLLAMLLHLVMNTKHDCYVKLVISSLDYAAPAMPRQILEAVLSCGSESSRLHTTQFLVVLLRARVPGFPQWGLSLLLKQLRDSSEAVRLAALAILDEACDEPTFLQSLAELHPPLRIDIDRELLLQIRMLSVPAGFAHLQQSGFLSAQMDHWAVEFNFRYVCLVEGEIHDALTLHQRGEDGHYSHRVSSAKHYVKDVFVPPHLYGQLTLLPQGYHLLIQDTRVVSLLQIVRNQQCSTDQEILNLKAALWAVGHIACGTLGVQWLAREGVIQAAVQLAQNCPVYSLRATAFYAIGLVATTVAGADVLSSLGWMTVRHHRHERWPVIHQNLNQNLQPQSELSHEDDLISQGVADETETESSLVTDEDESSLWDDSASRNGVQFWNEASPTTGNIPTSRKACTLPHQRAAPVWPRKQQRSLSESQSGSPQLQRTGSSLSSSTSTPGRDAVERHSSANLGTSTGDLKNHLSNCPDSLSDSSSAVKPSSERVQTLSPIPSSTSLNTLKSSTAVVPPSPLVTPLTSLQQEKRCRRSSLQGSITSEHLSPTHSVLSARLSQQDVAGYATLRSLQRQQRPPLPNLSSNFPRSLGITDNFLDDFQILTSSSSSRGKRGSSIFSSMRRLKVRSLDRQSSQAFFMNYDSKSKLQDDFFSSTPVTARSSTRLMQKNLTSSLNQCYIGISLPLSLYSLFGTPTKSPAPTRANESQSDSISHRRSGEHDVCDTQGEQEIDTRQRRRTSLSFSEMESVQETGEDLELPHSLQPSSESDDDFESEEGGGSRLERDRGRMSRRSARSARSGRRLKTHPRRKRERSSELSYTEVRPYCHQTSCCLICSLRQPPATTTSQRERKISAGSYNLRARTETESSCATTEATESPSRLRTISVGAFGGSVDSTTSIDTIGSAHDSSIGVVGKSKTILRSEIMRHVECMSNPMWIKPCKQAILQAKQKYPQMLDDVCLYSDICDSLASCSYRLQARRFLQEIFLDVSFSEVFEEAVNILKLSPLQSVPVEGQHIRSISVSLPPSEGLVTTGAVKVVDPPLSMVLEEHCGSEEPRGSCCSAPGSIPSEMSEDLLHITGRNVKTSTKVVVSTNPKDYSQYKNENGGNQSSSLCNDEHKQEATETSNLEPSCLTATFEISKLHGSGEVPAEQQSDEIHIKDEALLDKPIVKKTVFSLLSQKDPIIKKKSCSEKCDTGNSDANGQEALCKSNLRLDNNEAQSPVCVLNCGLQSGDSEEIKPLCTKKVDESLDVKSQQSPTKIRKVATVCQPSLAILQSGNQQNP